MKNKMILLLVFVTLPNLMQTVLPNGYAQETPQYFEQTMRMPNSCPVTHLYSTKFIVPVMVKVIHDPTPNFNVGSATNSTAPQNSVVNFNGDDKYSFLIRTNSTGQFSFLVKATYNDGVEHPIYAQYWSENQQISVDQFSTTGGIFCRNFLVDTAPPSPIVDIQKTIQNAEATTFAQIVAVLSQDHDALGQLQVIVIVFLGSVIFVQIISMIFHSSEGRWRKEDKKKLKQLESKFEEGARLLIVQNKHSALHEKINNERNEKFIQTILINLDMFRNEIKDMLKKQNAVIEPKPEPEIPKTEPKETVASESPEITLEELIPKPEPVEETKEEKKTGISKFVSSIQDHLGKKKIMQKTEKKILAEEQWFKILKEEKKLTEKQATEAYKKLEKYVNGHPEDANSYNKLLALYKIAVGDKYDSAI